MRARPSTAETCTGTSNTASRSAAPRVVVVAVGASASGSTGGIAPRRCRGSGSGTLLSSLMLDPPDLSSSGIAAAAPRAEIAADGVADGGVGLGRGRGRRRRRPIRSGSRRARSRARRAPRGGPRSRGARAISSSRVAWRSRSSASLTRTTTCGAAASWRKHSVASAAISANGSRAISSGASLRATATATSTASASSRLLDRGEAARQPVERVADLLERDRGAARGDGGAFLLGRRRSRRGSPCSRPRASVIGVLGRRDRLLGRAARRRRSRRRTGIWPCAAILSRPAPRRRGSWRS